MIVTALLHLLFISPQNYMTLFQSEDELGSAKETAVST